MAEDIIKPNIEEVDLGDYQFGFHDDVTPIYSTGRGLTEEVVRAISAEKEEPEWMLDFRLKSLEAYHKLPLPKWGPDLSGVNFDDIIYYQKASDKPARSWDDVPEKIKETFERIGIPEAERAYLAGASAQYESEVVYHNMKDEFTKLGIVFTDTDSALKEYPEIFKKYFAKLVPPTDNKLAALNSAVWSGGTFIYVPKGIKVDIPLQTYFRINNENTGQFERTLIVVDEGASVHYVEGCTAPTYNSNSLHAAVQKENYIYTIGKPWTYNVLIAPFSFSIEKSDAVWQEEADSVKAAFAPYFSRNAAVAESALADFDRFYNDSLKKLVWDESYRILRRRLEKVYSDGVVSASDEDILSDRELFRLYEGNTSVFVQTSSVRSIRDAYRYVTDADIYVYDRYILLEHNLENYIHLM